MAPPPLHSPIIPNRKRHEKPFFGKCCLIIGKGSTGKARAINAATPRAAPGNITFPFFQGFAPTDSAGKLHLERLRSTEKVDDATYNCGLWDCIYDSEENHITADDVLWSINKFSDMGNTGAHFFAFFCHD